jgi:hypothetical protein
MATWPEAMQPHEATDRRPGHRLLPRLGALVADGRKTTGRQRAYRGRRSLAGLGGGTRARWGCRTTRPQLILLPRSYATQRPESFLLRRAPRAGADGGVYCRWFWSEEKGVLDAGKARERSGEEKEGRRVLLLMHPCSPPDGDHGRAVFSSVEQRPGRCCGVPACIRGVVGKWCGEEERVGRCEAFIADLGLMMDAVYGDGAQDRGCVGCMRSSSCVVA